jgi:undecaprenyl-diphosphatase
MEHAGIMNIFEFLKNIDITVYRFINADLKSQFLDLVMPWISDLGSGKVFFALAVIFVLLKAKDKKALGILIFAGMTLSYYVVQILKEVVARPRPFLVLEGARVLDKVKDFSFPSGHATAIFIMAVILSSYARFHVLVYSFAVLVCASRIYLGMHYPSDVIAGALIGLVLGKALVKVSSEAEFRK